MAKKQGALLVLACALPGCMVGPSYERPTPPAPQTLRDTAAVTTVLRITHEAPWDRWWEVFKEPRLDALVELARSQNRDLRAAVARVHAARALVREAFGPLLPLISANGSYAYQKQSPNATFLGAGSTFKPANVPFDLVQGTADMSYELDLWGRIRRGWESATGDALATEEDEKNVEITLVADVAQTYFDLGQAEADLEIAREAVSLRTRTLQLVKGRVDAGLAAELELRQAEGELATTAAQVPDAELRRQVAEHRLAILTGRAPDVHFQGKAPAAFDLPPEVPVGIPSTLLERRPDIRAAEARYFARNSGVGEAIANYFPQVTIAGRFGYASVDINAIARPTAKLWSIGPSIHIPIFEGGRTKAFVDERQARKDEALANYEQTVLRAFGEVADAIAGISAHAQVRDRQAEAVKAETRAVELANIEYDQGLTSYLNVLDAQRTLLTARQALVRAQRQLLFDLVALEKALGGGWTAIPGDDAAPKEKEH
ncbi:efflux transporter outer membrane subunit [bacterium]|nr:efflux transporter outer membrane subunit [bacterium]